MNVISYECKLFDPKMKGYFIFGLPLLSEKFGCQGQGGDENLREMKHANVFSIYTGHDRIITVRCIFDEKTASGDTPQSYFR